MPYLYLESGNTTEATPMNPPSLAKTTIVTLMIISVLLTSCQTTGLAVKEAPDGQEPIRIGAILMLSGIGSNWGISSRHGAEIAVTEINADGGVNGRTLELEVQDNKGDNPSEAVTALNNLIAQGITIVLGPNWSPSGIAVAPIACDNKVLMISPSLGVANFNERCDLLFNLWPHDHLLSRNLGALMYSKGHRRIAILGSSQVWEETQARAVKEGIESAGGTVVSFQLSPGESQDFRTEILKLKETKPDAIMIQYTYQHLIAKQLRQMGVSLPLYVTLTDDERIVGAEGALEGAISITSFTPKTWFVEGYTTRYGVPPEIGSDTSYDAVKLIAQAMKSTGSMDPSKIKEYLGSLPSYEGASGTMTFDGKRGVTKPYEVVRITGKKTELMNT